MALFLFIVDFNPEQAGAGLQLFYERLGVAMNEPLIQQRANRCGVTGCGSFEELCKRTLRDKNWTGIISDTDIDHTPHQIAHRIGGCLAKQRPQVFLNLGREPVLPLSRLTDMLASDKKGLKDLLTTLRKEKVTASAAEDTEEGKEEPEETEEVEETSAEEEAVEVEAATYTPPESGPAQRAREHVFHHREGWQEVEKLEYDT